MDENTNMPISGEQWGNKLLRTFNGLDELDEMLVVLYRGSDLIKNKRNMYDRAK
jgi:hypothetical protein